MKKRIFQIFIHGISLFYFLCLFDTKSFQGEDEKEEEGKVVMVEERKEEMVMEESIFEFMSTSKVTSTVKNKKKGTSDIEYCFERNRRRRYHLDHVREEKKKKVPNTLTIDRFEKTYQVYLSLLPYIQTRIQPINKYMDGGVIPSSIRTSFIPDISKTKENTPPNFQDQIEDRSNILG